MAALGNIGKVRRTVKLKVNKPTKYAFEKKLNVTITLTGATVNETILLFENNALIRQMIANGSGGCTFYDMDDGTYYARGLDEADHLWRVEVSGTTVTVTNLTPTGGGGGGTTSGHAFIGT